MTSIIKYMFLDEDILVIDEENIVIDEEFDNYDVKIKLSVDNENPSITFKINNRINFQSFQSQFDDKYFKLPFSIKTIFTLIVRCLKQEKNYNISFIENSVLVITFDILFNGDIPLNFCVMLNSKIMVDERKYQELEETVNKLTIENNELKKKLDKFIQENKNSDVLLGEKLLLYAINNEYQNQEMYKSCLTASSILGNITSIGKLFTYYYYQEKNYEMAKKCLKMGVDKNDNNLIITYNHYFGKEEPKMNEESEMKKELFEEPKMKNKSFFDFLF